MLVAVRDCLHYLCEIVSLFSASFAPPLCSFCSFPQGIVIFLCLESAGDVISVASLLIAVTGIVCTGSRSGEGCSCAPEV